MPATSSEEVLDPVAARWAEVLRKSGYELSVKSRRDVRRLSRLSRTWRIILNATGLKPPASVFELGCGGGAQLIPLALNGFVCRGIDASAEVLARFTRTVEVVSSWEGRPLPIKVVEADFLRYRMGEGEEYDLVFHFGVLEHYLDHTKRLEVLGKMVRMCRPGGYLVSVVPSGLHPERKRQRALGLGGYCVPEIDYSPSLMSAEFKVVGAEPLMVRCHNLFGYLRMKPNVGQLQRLIDNAVYYAAQLSPALEGGFATRHAGSFIGIARRPLRGS